MCLFDKDSNQLIGNAIFVNASWKKEKEDEWIFDEKEEKDDRKDNSIVIKFANYDPKKNISIVFEFIAY